MKSPNVNCNIGQLSLSELECTLRVFTGVPNFLTEANLANVNFS